MRRLRGSSLIEFALGLTVLTFAAVELTRWVANAYVLHQMQAALHQAAHWASSEPLAFKGSDARFEQRVRNVVLYGNPDGGSMPSVPGLHPNNVRVEIVRQASRPSAVNLSIHGYEGPGGAVILPAGPRVSMPYRGRLAGF
jgi:hypothetical protein